MPYKSKAQRRKFYAMEAEGELPKGTAKRWSKHTKDKNLPEKVGGHTNATWNQALELSSGPLAGSETEQVEEKAAEAQDLDAVTETEKVAAVLGIKTAKGKKWSKDLAAKMKKKGKTLPPWLKRISGDKED